MQLEGLQAGNASLPQLFQGILLDLCSDEHPEARDVLSEYLQNGVFDPVRAEVDARLDLPHVGPRAARVDRLLKERNPCLPPQSLAEEERGSGRDREGRSSGHQRDVVEAGELRCAHLEMHLKARVRRLQHHRLVLDEQLVHALQVELVGPPAEVVERGAEGEVALLRSHVLEGEIRFLQRGKNAREDDPRAHLRRGMLDRLQERGQLCLQAPQTITAERDRVEVELQVEERQLVGDSRVVEALEHLDGLGSRVPVLVDQEHLLLHADPADARLDRAGRKHLLECLDVSKDLVGEDPAPLPVEAAYVFLTHEEGLQRAGATEPPAGRQTGAGRLSAS